LKRITQPWLATGLPVHKTQERIIAPTQYPYLRQIKWVCRAPEKKEKPVRNMKTFDGQQTPHEYLCMTYRPLARKIEPQARAATI
jgi:hypothetical protein